MSQLLDDQQKFTMMVALLIQFIYQKGYKCTFGDAYATTGHCKNSYHDKRLAIDLNLFRGDMYLQRTNQYEFLGVFWESIGGTWGGNWNDGNHFSYGEK